MKIRKHDLDEAQVLYPGRDPYELLDYSLNNSIETFEYHREDTLLAVGGVAESPMTGYTVWLVGTPDMDKLSNQRYLLRKGREHLKKLKDKYCRLSNFCSADAGQLWAMKQLGFEVYETGHDNVRFLLCA